MSDWVMAFDVDLDMRADGDRLWTVLDHDAALPDVGDLVIVACLEKEQKGYGFGSLVRVHDVTPLPRQDPTRPADWMVEFDWTAAHSCHPLQAQHNFFVPAVR